MTRHVAMIINQFSPIGGIVANSDLLVTLPERIALQHVNTYDLKILKCPLEAPEAFSRTSVIWHGRLGTPPALAWLCDLMAEVA